MRFGKVMAIMVLLQLVACGGEPERSHKTPKAKAPDHAKLAQRLSPLKRQQLTRAVMMLEANVGNLQGGGGYQMWTATKMVQRLLTLHRPRQSAAASKPPGGRPEIAYTMGKVTRPWQIVLIPDDARKQITVKAYGETTVKPALVRQVHVSTY